MPPSATAWSGFRVQRLSAEGRKMMRGWTATWVGALLMTLGLVSLLSSTGSVLVRQFLHPRTSWRQISAKRGTKRTNRAITLRSGYPDGQLSTAAAAAHANRKARSCRKGHRHCSTTCTRARCSSSTTTADAGRRSPRLAKSPYSFAAEPRRCARKILNPDCHRHATKPPNDSPTPVAAARGRCTWVQQ